MPHDRRALLDGHREVLRRAHRAARAARARRRAARARRTSGGCPRALGQRRHRHQAGDRQPGSARGRRRARRARSPLLPASPATLTSTRTSSPSPRRAWPSCASTESLATEWMRRTSGSDLADLAALQVADEVPRERRAIAQAVALASSSWARFSPSSVTPASASAPSSSSGDVLDRGEHLDVRWVAAGAAAWAIASRTRGEVGAHARGVEAGRSAPPRDPRLPAGDAAVAAVAEEALGVAHRAEPDVVDLVDAGRARSRRARSP